MKIIYWILQAVVIKKTLIRSRFAQKAISIFYPERKVFFFYGGEIIFSLSLQSNGNDEFDSVRDVVTEIRLICTLNSYKKKFSFFPKQNKIEFFFTENAVYSRREFSIHEVVSSFGQVRDRGRGERGWRNKPKRLLFIVILSFKVTKSETWTPTTSLPYCETPDSTGCLFHFLSLF